ncbi:MAG: hypothetical protein RL329_155 [Bacteroidota bacterium]|jgi:hypothetical protein
MFHWWFTLYWIMDVRIFTDFYGLVRIFFEKNPYQSVKIYKNPYIHCIAYSWYFNKKAGLMDLNETRP